jgi:hypothetical protein
MPRRLTLLLILLAGALHPAIARVPPQKWGIVLTAADSVSIKAEVRLAADSLLHLTSKQQHLQYSIQRARPVQNAAPDFYLLCFLCLMLGIIRYFDPRYFALLIGAYRNPGAGRQWNEMLRAAALPNLGMNFFFAAVAGAYIYYLSGGRDNHLLGVRAPLVLPLLIGGMILIYAGKYLIVRFSGWAFRVESLADQYIFNVFLVNKIVGIVLLPFVVIIAFAGPQWVQPIGILSGAIALILFSTRYLRSWSAFLTFFRGSKFHFFTYLCASEILPMAVLVKWLLHLMR